MEEHFTRFARKKQENYWLKTYQEPQEYTTRRTTSTIWRIFAELNNLLSLKLGYKQAIENEFNIDRGKHVLACF